MYRIWLKLIYVNSSYFPIMNASISIKYRIKFKYTLKFLVISIKIFFIFKFYHRNGFLFKLKNFCFYQNHSFK